MESVSRSRGIVGRERSRVPGQEMTVNRKRSSSDACSHALMRKKTWMEEVCNNYSVTLHNQLDPECPAGFGKANADF